MRDHDHNARAARVRRAFLKFEIYTDEVGMYRWRLLAWNGHMMATSRESYLRSEDVHRAIIALQASIPVARIVDAQSADRSAP